MINNSWFKKERPLLGMLGFGGGLAQSGSGGDSNGHTWIL